MERKVVAAAVVAHHAEPHRGDREKFWRGSLISLCAECHDSDAQIIERGGQPKQVVPVEGWRAE
jgi:5-methylcytosine-specific restriction protein A